MWEIYLLLEYSIPFLFPTDLSLNKSTPTQCLSPTVYYFIKGPNMEPVNHRLKTQKPWVQIEFLWVVFSDNVSQRSLAETHCSKHFKYLISCFLKIKPSSKMGNSYQCFTKQEMEMQEG